MTSAAFSTRRAGLIAQNTLREAVRQRLFHFLLLLAVGLVPGAQYFREVNFGAPELKFIADLGFGAIGLLGVVLTVTATAQLFFSELESRTVLTLLAKPVGRAEFVLGKFLGTAAVTGLFCASLTLLLAAVLWSRETTLLREYPGAIAGGRVINYGHLAVTGSLLWLKLTVLGALTLLVASYARTALFTMTTGALIYLVCHLQPFVHEAAARSGSGFTRILAGLFGRVFPNFQLFNPDEVPGEYLIGITAYGLGYVAAACTLAVFSFSRREI
jgi:ABC-type transport system involved in multi-copper enzyme maturation permease subunit